MTQATPQLSGDAVSKLQHLDNVASINYDNVDQNRKEQWEKLTGGKTGSRDQDYNNEFKRLKRWLASEKTLPHPGIVSAWNRCNTDASKRAVFKLFCLTYGDHSKITLALRGARSES